MDQALIYKLNSGDENALREVFDTLYGRLHTVSFNNTNHSCEDDRDIIISDVFLSLWRQLKSGLKIKNTQHLLRWLDKCVAQRTWGFNENRKGPKYRLLRFYPTLYNFEIEDIPTNIEEMAFIRAVQRVKRAIKKLPPQCRLIFEMWAFDDMSYEEIGITLNISPQTARNQKTRAISLLKKRLKVK